MTNGQNARYALTFLPNEEFDLKEVKEGIVEFLHLAHSEGHDPVSIIRDAVEAFTAEAGPVETEDDETVPIEYHPLPDVPKGFDRWVWRGKDRTCNEQAPAPTYAVKPWKPNPGEQWSLLKKRWPYGNGAYIEAVKDKKRGIAARIDQETVSNADPSAMKKILEVINPLPPVVFDDPHGRFVVPPDEMDYSSIEERIIERNRKFRKAANQGALSELIEVASRIAAGFASQFDPRTISKNDTFSIIDTSLYVSKGLIAVAEDEQAEIPEKTEDAP